MSFGFEHEHDALVSAVKYASQQHVIMFAAASNAGSLSLKLPYPASDMKVFLVHCNNGYGGLSDRNHDAATYRENFSILGQDVRSIWPSNCEALGTFTAEGIGLSKRSSGTSVATPILASTCALIFQFGRKWSDLSGFESLETWAGVRKVLLAMAKRKGSQHSGSILEYASVIPWRVLNHEVHTDIIRAKFRVALSSP